MVDFVGTCSDIDSVVCDLQIKLGLLPYALRALIVPLTGLQSTSVIWEKDPRPMVSDIDNAIVTLSLKSSDYIGGSDDKRRTLSGSTYTYELAGIRKVTLTIKCEAYNYHDFAYFILERIRTQLHSNFELTNIGMSYIDSVLITGLPTTYDNRVVDVGVLELNLGLVSNYLISEQIGQGWIDTVNTNDKVPGTLNR